MLQQSCSLVCLLPTRCTGRMSANVDVTHQRKKKSVVTCSPHLFKYLITSHFRENSASILIVNDIEADAVRRVLSPSISYRQWSSFFFKAVVNLYNFLTFYTLRDHSLIIIGRLFCILYMYTNHHLNHLSM